MFFTVKWHKIHWFNYVPLFIMGVPDNYIIHFRKTYETVPAITNSIKSEIIRWQFVSYLINRISEHQICLDKNEH